MYVWEVYSENVVCTKFHGTDKGLYISIAENWLGEDPNGRINVLQTWESGISDVPRGVLGGYPEIKILGVGYPASPR
jgi:hypothetical protein